MADSKHVRWCPGTDGDSRQRIPTKKDWISRKYTADEVALLQIIRASVQVYGPGAVSAKSIKLDIGPDPGGIHPACDGTGPATKGSDSAMSEIVPVAFRTHYAINGGLRIGLGQGPSLRGHVSELYDTCENGFQGTPS